MIRLYDFECPKCGVYEDFADPEEKVKFCHKCHSTAKRIISFGDSAYLGNQSPAWMKSVLDVVDKENKAPHVQAFVKNPTRENYKAWMRGEGIRPADHTEGGGPPTYKRPERDERKIVDELYRRHRERKSISLSS